MMERMAKRHYFRLIYRKTFHYLVTALVVCPIMGAFYGDRLYLIYALCAYGTVLIGWGWVTYLAMHGQPLFCRVKRNRRIPYMYRTYKGYRRNGPSFSKDFRDFDDDLVRASVVDEYFFSKTQVAIAKTLSRMSCGTMLIIISFAV